jgi:hypothetical protein
MKYTARHIRRFIEQGKIDPSLWKNHFPTIPESKVPECRDCEDHKNNLCQGGKDPVDCFIGIQLKAGLKSGTDTGKKKSKLHEWKGTDGKTIPRGANKVYDQSKM